MALGYVNMGAFDRPFDERPKAFNCIRVVAVARPFILRVIDRAVNVAALRQLLIGVPFVGADGRSSRYVLDQVRLNGGARHVGDNTGDDISTAFGHAENQRLAESAATLTTLAVPANHRFVGLNVARQRLVAVHNGKILADFVPHSPRRFVVHAQLTLQFLGGNSVTRRGEQVHRIEPLLERRMRAIERRSHHRVDVFAALACIGGHLRQLLVFACFPAARAFVIRAKASLEQMLKAGVVVREHLHEFGDRHWLGHGRSPSLP